MRASDVARLSQPYGGDPNLPGPGPAAALGVDPPNWSQLENTILDDLSVEAPYGIAWWAPHPGTCRRILISDQLYACAHSTGDNLIEAGLHWLEFLDFADRESDRLAFAVKVENGEFVVKAPRRQSPFEDVGLELVRLHIAGMVRALAGALDCMAGAMIGVVAVPTRILRADFGVVRSMLRKIAEKPSCEGQGVQADFGKKLDSMIASSGADGWLDWALAFCARHEEAAQTDGRPQDCRPAACHGGGERRVAEPVHP